jgi:CubicO group peptidase (beta-lactamase class C family)
MQNRLVEVVSRIDARAAATCATISLVGIALASEPQLARAQAARIQPVTAAQIDSIVQHAVADKHIIGLSVGVMQDGKVVLAKGYGVRDIASKTPVSPQTMFAVGSVTKQFTCTAMLQLVEQKKLSLDDPIAKWYPNLTRAKEITLRDLGGHLSGYRDYYPLDFVDQEMAKDATPDAIINEYATRPLDFEPRSRYSYSNTGFILLGRVVEKTSGQSFGAYLQQHIFTPLKMTRTTFEPASVTGDMAKGYTSFALAPPILAVPEAKGWASTAGAIWSTPSDLLTWDQSILDHKLLTPASYAFMTTAQRLTDGRSSGYGCGEGVNDRGSAVVLSHGGAVSGYVAQNTVIPATRSAVVLLSNSDFSPMGQLNQDLVSRLLPRGVDAPIVAGRNALDASKKFLGELEKGTVDRSTLGQDFSVYLTADKVAEAKKALNGLGAISNIRVAGTGERGGMEVATVLFDIGKTPSRGLMYRTPDGKIQEFLFARN